MIETEAVELVECAMVSKSVVALIRDLLLPNQFLFRPRQFLRCKTIICELVNFIEQSGSHWLDFLRIGAEIKRKKSRHQALHLARANVVRQAHLFSNTNEEAGPKIAARFIDQFECVPIRTRQTRTAEADHNHALCFVLAAFNHLRFA